MRNKNLHKAKAEKNDEFYTQLPDIERELKHYTQHFKNKKVLCNCDDPRESNFFKYFALQFNVLGLKELIATCYKNVNPDLFSKHDNAKAVYQIYKGERRKDNYPDMRKSKVKTLEGNGSYDSPECREILEDADIVVTNPPFSLFRDFIKTMLEYNKKILILGSMNSAGYKEIFPLIRYNKIWLGISPRGMDFKRPDGTMKNINACWFTNLSHAKRNEFRILHSKYNPKDYPKYDNYNAININFCNEIPKDYYGTMGVPITFLENHNPKQFKIVGHRKGNDGKDLKVKGKEMFHRVLIQRIKHK